MSTERHYDFLPTADAHKPIKSWTRGVPVEPPALKQLQNMASLPFIYKWLAVMPDVHLGKGATVGSVVATHKAIIPAAVGVDIGCGMMAVQTSLAAHQLPDSLREIRSAIEAAVPHGRDVTRGGRDKGTWGNAPAAQLAVWKDKLAPGFERITAKHGAIKQTKHLNQLGTLGTGNHFIELCLDETDQVWVMLHSGSRGVGNKIGSHFIEKAKREMERFFMQLPDRDLAYLPEGSQLFDDYVEAVEWAQEYAMENRRLMMQQVLAAMRGLGTLPEFHTERMAVNCHHNYVAREHHYGEDVLVTRKGAVRAREGDLGIIPGSMGARSFIVRGKGNPESFCSCSHGAGRVMSRTEAKRRFTEEDHARATQGIECRKDADVIDETPMAYKDIEAVMAAQSDLVEIVHTLRQVVCVKG
jgi:tRNA-splicing ligase RtcB